MKITLVSLYWVIRGALYSLIIVPASFLFLVLLISSNGSISGWYIDNARERLHDVPYGMVRDCEQEKIVSQDMPGPVNVGECKEMIVEQSEWQKTMDHSLLFMYYCLVFVACFSYIAMYFSRLSDSISKIKLDRKQ